VQERIETAGDGADIQRSNDTERHLTLLTLRRACTRAWDHLLVTGVTSVSALITLGSSSVPAGSGLLRSASSSR
jgi:hypothetical protein